MKKIYSKPRTEEIECLSLNILAGSQEQVGINENCTYGHITDDGTGYYPPSMGDDVKRYNPFN